MRSTAGRTEGSGPRSRFERNQGRVNIKVVDRLMGTPPVEHGGGTGVPGIRRVKSPDTPDPSDSIEHDLDGKCLTD